LREVAVEVLVDHLVDKQQLLLVEDGWEFGDLVADVLVIQGRIS